jgi:hypothetical protein
MVGRVLQLTGTALVIAVAAVTPLLVTASTTPASADTVIGGCTIVSNPTPTNFTDCPNSELAGASLTGLNLSYANFSGSTFAFCGSAPPPNCDATDFHDANLTGADLTGIRVAAFVFFTSDQTGSFPETGSAAADFSGANLSGVNLTNTSIAGANLTDANLTGATLTGAAMTEQVPPGVTVNAIFPGANFTNTVLVPLEPDRDADEPGRCHGDVVDATGNPRCDARQLHARLGIDIPARPHHCHLSGP